MKSIDSPVNFEQDEYIGRIFFFSFKLLVPFRELKPINCVDGKLRMKRANS